MYRINVELTIVYASAVDSFVAIDDDDAAAVFDDVGELLFLAGRRPLRSKPLIHGGEESVR